MSRQCRVAAVLAVGAILFAGGSTLAAVPTQMTVQGKLTNSAGDPVPAGPKTFTFKIYAVPVGANPVWPAGNGEVQSISTDADGLWAAQVGAVTPLTDAVFTNEERWLEVTVDDGVNPPETLSRVKLNTNPYTFQSEQSANAASLGGQPPSAYAASAHSHDASAVTDEPGIASAVTDGVEVTLAQGTTNMTDLVACSITTPAAGYINVQGRTTGHTWGTTGINIAFCQIDESAGGDVLYPNSVEFGRGSGPATDEWETVFVDRVYFKPAGTYVFRLEARAFEFNGSGACLAVRNSRITACFFPTAYGTVVE
ncbi:MAG: hypothetical protein AB1792_00805 [Candidatus Zixiibacteriota bacterium]